MKGLEAGKPEEQKTGLAAQYVVRDLVPNASDPDGAALQHDIVLESGVCIDVKCRGGDLPFKLAYERSAGKVPREAKHNFFARQLFDDKYAMATDVYVLCHLIRPSLFPGTRRQRKWKLYICGWVSAARAKRAIFLPLGSLTEQGNTWFPYRAHEVEFYHRNLCPVWVTEAGLAPLTHLTAADVEADAQRSIDRHMTTTDYARVVADLHAHGLVREGVADARAAWEPILHRNQYWHATDLLEHSGIRVDREALEKLVRKPQTYADIVNPKGEGPADDPDE